MLIDVDIVAFEKRIEMVLVKKVFLDDEIPSARVVSISFCSYCICIHMNTYILT